MGCKLLIRTSHEITLTEYGETLLPRAKNILKQAADCKEHIHELNNCMTGESLSSRKVGNDISYVVVSK